MDKIHWSERIRNAGYYWKHCGHPKAPHVIVGHEGGGVCVDNYIDRRGFVGDPSLVAEAGTALASAFGRIGDLSRVDRVVGVMPYSATLAHEIALQITRYRSHFGGRPCMTANLEPSFRRGRDPTYELSSSLIKRGESILLAVLQTKDGDRIKVALDAIERYKGNPLPFVTVVFNQGTSSLVGEAKLISLVHDPLTVQSVATCTLCSGGSARLSPWTNDNWSILRESSE